MLSTLNLPVSVPTTSGDLVLRLRLAGVPVSTVAM